MAKDREEALTLELLAAIEASSDVTQRHLADRMGVALGLANSYLKRCVRKGLVKITQAPANRYLYYLTPKGFAEKSRLTAEYLSYSFEFYRRASASTAAALAECREAGRRRMLLAGISELAEIASVRAHDYDIEIVGTVDAASGLDRFVGKPVWTDLDAAAPADVCLYTALAPVPGWPAALHARFGPGRVVVPDIVQAVAGDAGAPPADVETAAGPV